MLSLSVCIYLRCKILLNYKHTLWDEKDLNHTALRILFSWDMTTCQSATGSQHFKGTQCPYLQELIAPRRIPLDILHYVPSKYLEPITHWHSVISQKKWILNHTAVKTSKLSAFIVKTELMALDWLPHSTMKDWQSTDVIRGAKCCTHNHILFTLLKP